MDFGPYTRKLEEDLKPENQKAFLAVMDPVAWATESHHLAQKHAYRDTKDQIIKSGETLGEEYANANEKIIDEQLTKAGLRLAAMLNRIYDPGTPMPEFKPTAAAPDPTKPIAPTPSAPAKAPSANAKFVGSRNSQVYHYPGCLGVKTIKPENLVEYAEAPVGKRLHEGCPR